MDKNQEQTIFWEFLLEQSLESDTHANLPDYSDRGISFLKKCTTPILTGRIDVLKQVIGINAGIESMTTSATAEISQMENLSKIASRVAWRTAEDWLASDRDEALRWLKAHASDWVPGITYAYVRDICASQLKKSKNIKPYPAQKQRRPEPMADDWWKPCIEVYGGSKHFVLSALALLLQTTVDIFFTTVVGMKGEGADMLKELAPKVRAQLAEAPGLWIEEFKAPVMFVASLNNNQLDFYIAQEVARRKAFLQLSREMFEAAQEVVADLQLAHKDVACLRSRMQKMADHDANQRAKIAQLQGDVDKARRGEEKLIRDEEIRTAIHSERLHVRELEQKNVDLQTRVEDLEQAQIDLKEFIDKLLSPVPNGMAESEPRRLENSKVADLRVIVVGGHERLHSKLRKRLPQATFLHPDRQLKEDAIFEAADCVVFCAHYCSHSLAIKAASATRRFSVPARYVWHNNPEMVLAEIASITRPEKAVVACH